MSGIGAADRRTDVSQLDFVRLRARGVTGIVFDKDDCLVRFLQSSTSSHRRRRPFAMSWRPNSRMRGPS